MPRVLVIGGGIAGLAVALELQRRTGELPDGCEVHCLEADLQPGGNIRTLHEDGFVCDQGPNGFLDNAPATLELVRRVGLEDRLLPAGEQSAIRWIWRAGALRRVPTGPGSFLRSGVLPASGRLRVLAEPFARKRPEGVDETVHDFAARRIGPQAARVLVGAMVAGVYAGDAKRLSLRSTFPKMYAMESEHGGLVRAMIAKAKAAKRAGTKAAGGPAGLGGRLTSFRDGFQELPDAVARALGDGLVLGCPVRRIAGAGAVGYRVTTDRGEETADAVVLATPAWHASEVVADLDAELASVLGEIPAAPVAVIQLGFRDEDLRERPRGFGFLVPRGEGPRILGVLWTSNLFTGRSPDGSFLMTVMAGGAHEPQVVELDDDGLVALARKDLRTTMGIGGAPRFVRVFRHPQGIPQYTVGHAERLDRIDACLARHPGLLVHGNSYRGVSVNLCVEQAAGVAGAVGRFLEARAGR